LACSSGQQFGDLVIVQCAIAQQVARNDLDLSADVEHAGNIFLKRIQLASFFGGSTAYQPSVYPNVNLSSGRQDS
jgi:hypothetical protein